ncbi:MAG: hypothetical protein H3C54_14235, partial [Taibaiella sp.]|nr:hypothetical protein [Taibaiella sp.]
MKKFLQNYSLYALVLFIALMLGNDKVSAANSTNWENFRQALTPRAYNKLVVLRDGVPQDSITNPVTVQAIAQALNTATTTPATQSWTVGTNTWYLGNCGNSVEFGIG